MANVHALYRDFGTDVPGDALTLLGEMAALAGADAGTRSRGAK